MAKKKKRNFNFKLWIIIPLTIIFFLLVLFLSLIFFLVKSTTNTSIPPHSTPTDYLLYQDPTFGFSIEYPRTWEIKKDTQVFEHGDAIAFRKTGPAQKQNTELTDGAQFVVSKPFSINTDLALWTKENFKDTAKFSKFPIRDHVFEQVYTCSNLGCMTYFFTPINGKVYGLAIFAEGPDKDKMVYENTTLYMFKSLKFKNSTNGVVTKEEAISKVKALPEVIEYLKRVPDGLVLVNGEEDNIYMVQVYEFKDGHTATFNWYKVNKTTGEVKKEF